MRTFIFLFVCVVSYACKNDKLSPASDPINTTEIQKTKFTQNKPKVMKDFHNIAYITGKFEPKERADFTIIEKKYADRTGMYMRQDAYEAFKKMHTAAKKDGITLTIRSAARNFDYQKGIWENKWTGNRLLSDGTNVAKDIADDVEKSLRILEYSSMPGSSRHHWGTDIDLNSFDNKWFASGEGLKLYEWMQKYGMEYGFCQVYCEKGSHREHGYNEEKWHYSFMPQSRDLLNFAKEHLQIKDISGFKGDHTAQEVDIINKYILGIDNRCQDH